MDNSSTTASDKNGSETSLSVDTTVIKHDSTTGVPVCRRRREHNEGEKKRKEQIKACICKMGELLPPSYITNERHSTLEIVEKSLAYMRELKEARTKFGATEEALQEELGQLRSERDKYLDIIKAAGLSTESLPTNGVSSTTDVKVESPKPVKLKSKKKNSVSSQLQQLQDRRDKQQQQEMISSSVSASEDGLGNMGAMMNMVSGPGFMNGPMFNPMMMQAGNQFIMPGMLGGGNQMMPGMGMIGPCVGLPGMQQPNSNGSITTHTPNSMGSQDGNMNRSMEENDAGLLQLAMQDAGITPGNGSQQNSTASLTPSIADTQEAESSSLTQNNPLQTLAHVATSNHEMLTDGMSSGDSQNNQSCSMAQMSSNNQTISLSASGNMMQSMVQTGNQSMLGMQGMGNQGPGPQQMQQIMFINEQGIPMIAQVPVGFDPNNPNMTQKQGILHGQKDPQSGIDQNALAMAQQQAVLQSQMLSQNNGANFQSMMQQGLIQGNFIQTPSGQILQQIGPHMSGQGQFIAMSGQGQSIMVAGQQGPMTLNAMMGQPNQLPSALILPNGQIVPVVTNPGSHGEMQGQMPRISGPHVQTGPDGQLMSGPSSQGLLMPATVSTAASLSTSVMPTSALQSVMTTQIQGSSVASQKTTSNVGSMPSLANIAGQPKLVAGMHALGANLIGVNPGGKQAPILISLPINGQPTTVLLDPITMQVLGTVNAQQTNHQMATSHAAMVTTAVTSQPSVSGGPNLQTAVGVKKNSKNNQNQRAICPKPLGPDGHPLPNTPAKKKKPSKGGSKTKEMAQADSLSDTLQIQIPESTTDPENSSAISSESTDILAKAAESIFSSPNGEVASVGGFYNPANEDNPLHIDTGVTELEEEGTGSKQFKKVVCSSNSVTESVAISASGDVKSSNGSKVVVTSQVVSNTGMAHTDNVTSLSNTLEEIAGFNIDDISDNFGQSITSKSQNDSSANAIDKNDNKKSKSSKNNDNKRESDTKSCKSSNSKSKTKKSSGEKNSLMDAEKSGNDSQMDIESTLIHIPENMTFSENDLSDVLDQVEQYGNSSVDSPSTRLSKKSKTKRSKPPEAEFEPNSKKRKSGKDVAKEVKPAFQAPQRELLSMPTNLSNVYDFEDSVDIVPSLLPLNHKDFMSSGPGTPTKPDLQKQEAKTKTNASSKSKNSAQKNSTALKGGKVSSSKDEPNSQPMNMQDKDSEKKLEKDPKIEGTVKTSPPSVKISETFHNMPDIDTTTSLFGYPVPKKIQKADMAGRQNKMTAQVSPKPSPQTSVPMASPKQNLVSPKTAYSVVSPNPSGPFSPELVSPKLSIVSPSQGIMSDGESITASPKQTLKDTSPLKKSSPADKTSYAKVSSVSAVNMSPVMDSVNHLPLSSKHDDINRQMPNASVQSHSMGVITSVKNSTSSDINKSSLQSNYGSMNDKNLADIKQSNSSSSVTHNMNTSSAMPLINSHQTMRTTPTNMDQTFNPNMNMNQTRPNSSVNSSQSSRYGPSFGSETNYGQMPGMNRSMSKDTGVGLNNYSAPYSAESLFNSQPDKIIKSPPNVNISTLNQPKPDNPMSKVRNNAYSVDSFVQSSRERPDSLTAHAGLMSAADYPNPTTDLARLQNESSPDGFHFTNIGLNLPPITSTAGNYMDNTSNNNPSSFSFSLSGSSSTVSSSSGGLGQHQFPPFFPPVLSTASNPPSSQTGISTSMQDMFDNRASDALQRNRHPPVNAMPGSDNSHMSRESHPHVDKAPSSISDNSSSSQNDKPSCSKQKLPKASGPATIQESFPFNSSSSAHDTNFFRDNQMKSNVGKSPNEQMRKLSQDKSIDISSQSSRSGSQDKRASTMDRSPQMMNNPQSYYPSTYQPSKSLITPPLHHPLGMMGTEDRSRNLTTRSPYEPPFPLPPVSQGFNSMGPGFPNRFDSGLSSFSRDNSGTQPLSHTPVNTSGRKSANTNQPVQTSVVKPPQKQSAPALVPMGGPQQTPSQAPLHSTPPQSHRATTPHSNNPSQSASSHSQVNQSRPSKQPSRSAKHPSSKKSKTMPFMEVDSNLSNSIFEPNRSMTPFFQSMQTLSPQSRAMQHESGPFQPGNFFGLGSRFPNSNTPMPKNSEIGGPFANPLFPPRGAQNGLGLNFQTGFGMNMNPLHGNHGNTPQFTTHSSHMANFNLNNFLSEGPSQNESSLPISPIKFGHTNSMLQHQGMDHNSMSHHHQYNRGHPGMMSINSILGANHHGFDGRMNTSMAGPFHSHGHPSFIPPLNFSMHDH